MVNLSGMVIFPRLRYAMIYGHVVVSLRIRPGISRDDLPPPAAAVRNCPENAEGLKKRGIFTPLLPPVSHHGHQEVKIPRFSGKI